MYRFYDNADWGCGLMGGFGGGLMMVFFWVLIATLIIWITREVSGRRSDSASVSTTQALDILKERYAKGEIDREEFERKKKDLSI
ncbi:MAG: electron transporter RnfE [Candidatus Vogelbacteria bacterium CG10_big_fil_rev_8_21_14_0_10_49_38]|uniref:Electron transporter RnfE n=1 Tax=Candidatus Vogelbacteria bacterium CG10_big_fil_rev_8_21_14_0_10_49_38 TaxID=1975043 RepID=A0A2H0RHF9_9BACT|nr:MAG: electron transporter RnfE [Candidatus Vogelbacteria bacterium CG10_big_fil_rev_8_21_14_0_10_49_38]